MRKFIQKLSIHILKDSMSSESMEQSSSSIRCHIYPIFRLHDNFSVEVKSRQALLINYKTTLYILLYLSEKLYIGTSQSKVVMLRKMWSYLLVIRLVSQYVPHNGGLLINDFERFTSFVYILAYLTGSILYLTGKLSGFCWRNIRKWTFRMACQYWIIP